MKKQTKVLAAATLFTLGATFSALAAQKNGTWVNGEDGWQYFDKEGEIVESDWCLDGTTEYWVNDEGVLGADEWVSDEKYSYYVDTDGSKAKNEWKYIYGEDDEDADEESWFYFDAKGRMVQSDYITWSGSRYYFDKDGKMLTGWIDVTDEDYEAIDGVDVADNKVVFCDENGARQTGWVHEFPWYEASEDLYEGEDEHWFYLNASPYYNAKKAIEGQHYVFNAKGEMMTGWVLEDYEGNFSAGNSKVAFSSETVANAYYCDDDYGYVKKNGWRELEDVTETDDYWFHFDKLGRIFMATDSDATATTYTEMNFENGEKNVIAPSTKVANVLINSKKIDGVVYYFNAEGEMIDGLIEIGDNMFYLEDGARQTGKVTLTDDNENDYTFYFADKTEDGYVKYAAVDGNADGYCYKNGQLQTSEEKGVYDKVTTGNGTFIVDYRGKIQHNETKEYFNENETFKFTTADGITEYSIVVE